MEIEYREATPKDAGLLIDIYNASFYSDYVRYGTCPGYGNSKEMMENWDSGNSIFEDIS